MAVSSDYCRYVKIKILRHLRLVVVNFWKNNNVLVTFWCRVKEEGGCKHDVPRTCPSKNVVSVICFPSLLLSLNFLPLEPSPLGGITKVSGKVSGRLVLYILKILIAYIFLLVQTLKECWNKNHYTDSLFFSAQTQTSYKHCHTGLMNF